MPFCSGKGFGKKRKKDFEWNEKAEIRKAWFLAVGEACRAIFWPAPGFRERTFDSFGFSAKGTLTSASDTTPRSKRWRTRRRELGWGRQTAMKKVYQCDCRLLRMDHHISPLQCCIDEDDHVHSSGTCHTADWTSPQGRSSPAPVAVC